MTCRSCDSSNDPWHKSLRRSALEALDFHCEDFDIGHLRVEELDNSFEGIRDIVRNEQQTKSPRREIRFDTLPKRVSIRLSVGLQQLAQFRESP